MYVYIFGEDNDTDEGCGLKPIGTASVLFNTTTVGHPAKDIGFNQITNVPENEAIKLQSTKQETLN